jgi:hypothetical protein
MPFRAPITAVVPWDAKLYPRRSTGTQHSGIGRVPSEICQESQPVSESHTRNSVRVCEA